MSNASDAQPVVQSWPAEPRGTMLLWFIAIVVLTAAVYLPATRCGYIWDDDDYVTQNELLWEPGGLVRIWTEPTASPQFYPMVFTTFWVEMRLWGINPMGYHITNIVIHGLAAAMFWLVLRRLKVPGAWLAAAVFAVHPVMVESVAWITERKNVLAGLFYFSSLLAYLRFDSLEPGGEGRVRDVRWWWFAFVLFLCALASKTITCSLPATILVLTWWKRGRIGLRDVAPTLPMFAIGLASGLFTSHLEKTHVWGGESDYHYSLLERGLIAGRVVWFYAGKLVWPTDLAFIYTRWHIDKSQLWQWVFPLAAIGLLIALWLLRKHITRGPLAAALLFGGTLFPAMGFFDIYPLRFSFVADHFQYLAAAWLLACIVGVLATVVVRMRWPQEAMNMAAAVLLLTLGGLTWNQQRIYLNAEALWRDTLSKSPECWMAMNNLGVIMIGQSKADEAIAMLENCLAIKPDYYIGRGNLGTAYLLKGNVSGAEQIFRQVVRERPDYPMGHMNLGLALARQGMWSSAESEYREAIAGDPKLGHMLKTIALALVEQGHTDMAGKHLDLYLELNPEDTHAKQQRDSLRSSGL